MRQNYEAFYFRLRAKNSLACKWIEQHYSDEKIMEDDDGVKLIYISEYLYNVLFMKKITNGNVSEEDFFEKICIINSFSKDKKIKYVETIIVPFSFCSAKINVKNSNDNILQEFKGLLQDLSSDEEILSNEELKEFALNILHINYDYRNRYGLCCYTYEEALKRFRLDYCDDDDEKLFYLPVQEIISPRQYLLNKTNITFFVYDYIPQKNKDVCLCNRDITPTEMTDLIYYLREKECEKEYIAQEGLFNINCDIDLVFSSAKTSKIEGSRAIRIFTEKVNATLRKYKINTCSQKIHFLAQCYHESNRFRFVYEDGSSDKFNKYHGGEKFKGRGLIQLTHDDIYLAYYSFITERKEEKSLYTKYLGLNATENRKKMLLDVIDEKEKELTVQDKKRDDILNKNFYDKKLIPFAESIQNDIELVVDSSGWFFGVYKRDILTIASKDISDKNIEKISELICGENPNGLKNRKEYTSWISNFFNYAELFHIQSLTQ